MMVLVPIHGVLSEKIEHMVSLNPLLHHFIEASITSWYIHMHGRTSSGRFLPPDSITSGLFGGSFGHQRLRGAVAFMGGPFSGKIGSAWGRLRNWAWLLEKTLTNN